MPEHSLKSFYIETWGCQMNVHDSERLAGMMVERGYRPTEVESEADLVLLNTCSVREKAVHKLMSRLGSLRGLKQLNPRLVVGVAGCVAQHEREKLLTRSPVVDLVVGPRALHKLPELLDQVVEGRKAVDVSQNDPRFDSLAVAPLRRESPHAYVTVMEGCNKNCSFCIVPFTRGREVYRPTHQILEEVRSLVQAGVLEVELLGQNVNSWLEPAEGSDFADLLRLAGGVEGLCRLRFTTSHPRHLSDRIVEAMADTAAVCPELHLPMQSGSDQILKNMYRGYTRARFLERIASLRAMIPGVALSTDVIVGFPGETEKDFQATLDVLSEVGFDQVYAFVYSPRPHTRALALDDTTDESLKGERLQRLLAEQRERQQLQNQSFVGSAVEVLCEGPSKSRPERYSGRSPCRRVVNFAASEDVTGQLVRVEIQRAGPYSLTGRLAPPSAA